MAASKEIQAATNSANAQIEALMKQLGGMSYSRPSSYSGYQSGYTPVDRSLPDWKPADLDVGDFISLAKEKKDGKSKVNLWDVLSGTLGQPSGLATSSIYNTVKTLTDKDTPLWKKLFTAANPLNDAIGQALKNGGKEQWKDWKDGKLSWGDVPGVGFLHGMDKGYKRGGDIMRDIAGVENKWGVMGGGLAIDIAADPLTYLTLGASAASKVSKAAEAAEMANQARKLGLNSTKFKNAAEFQAAAEAKLAERYAKYPNLSQSMAKAKAGTMRNEIAEKSAEAARALTQRLATKKTDEAMQAINAARAKAFNSNVNSFGFSVPFTNKVGIAGQYGEKMMGGLLKNPLYRSEATVGNDLVENLLKTATGGDSALAKQFEDIAKTRLGISDISQMTKTQFDELHEFLQPLIQQLSKGGLPDVEVVSKIVENVMPQADFDRLMTEFVNQNIPWKDVQKQLNGFMSVIGKDPVLRETAGKVMAQKIADFWAKKAIRARKPANVLENAAKSDSMGWASRFLGGSGKYQTVENTVKAVHPKGNPTSIVEASGQIQKLGQVQKDGRAIGKAMDDLENTPYARLSDTKTTFEHFLDRNNPFDSRTLNTSDKFLNTMGDHISDAHSQRVGETAMYSKDLSQIQKFVKDGGYTDKEMQEAIYALENHFPSSYGKNYTPTTRVQELADTLKPIIQRIGDNETAGGVLSKLRANYFPHVRNFEGDSMEAIADYMARNRSLLGLKSNNAFNNARKGFQTLAERDNYIEKVRKAIQKETDPATIESLEKHLESVAKMFDTNVVTALTRRVREGVRAKAMKAMQGELSKFGMMKTIKKGSGEAPPSGFKRLEPDEVKKLGLPEGTHYMHPEVFKALQRTDEIFTNEGMNKAARFVSAIGDIWRPLVTYYKPAHYINNMIGNTINNMAAGVKVRDVKNASKLLMKYRKGTLNDEEMKIIKAAYKHNVISGGFLFDSRPTFEFDKPWAIEKFAEKVGDNKVVKKIRHGGEVIDDVSRLANFLNGVDKFGSTAKAAQQVRKYLFNYNELTNADRGMRVLVPFWNWMKRNIPLQLKLLQETPGFALNVERFKDYWNDGEKGADWQKESGLKFGDYYTTLPSPTNDLSTVLNPMDSLGSLTPAIKMPIEMKTNKSLFTGNPISYGSNELQNEDMLSYIMSNLGIGNNVYQGVTGDKSAFEKIMSVIKPVSRVNPNQ
jgi:hypothetical protein